MLPAQLLHTCLLPINIMELLSHRSGPMLSPSTYTQLTVLSPVVPQDFAPSWMLTVESQPLHLGGAQVLPVSSTARDADPPDCRVPTTQGPLLLHWRSAVLSHCPCIAGSAAAASGSPHWRQGVLPGDTGPGPRHEVILFFQGVQ